MPQIKERGYADRFAADTRTVTLVGANFSTSTRTLPASQLLEFLSSY